MKELILSQDKHRLNWADGTVEWGTVKCDLPLDVEVRSERNGDVIREDYIFTNSTDKSIFTHLSDIGIYTPFNDDYTTAEECMTHKCHTHIWCGGEVSYVMALRMGGEAPHLGMVLNKGSLGGYSVERDIKRMSNDRGDFILHPSPFSLAPGESYTVSWTLFPHSGKEDFYLQAAKHCEKFLEVRAERYILFDGESSAVEIKADFEFDKGDVQISLNGSSVAFDIVDNVIRFQAKTEIRGEMKYLICVGGVHTYLRLLVLPAFWELAKTRCRFIAEKQQYHKAGSPLDGAYLIYDNEEEAQFYSDQYDHNGGRERVGMGLSLTAYLQRECDAEIEQSLQKYIAYVKRELVNEETGEVYNDCGRDNSYKRLYNCPWYSLLFIELYKLYGDKSYLIAAYRILVFYYENGGDRFYPIELPSVQITKCLNAEKMDEEADVLMAWFIRHADYIAYTGTKYPAHEVNYEQSIASPAADILYKAYELTSDKKYLIAAKEQLSVLELFNGTQPDYHLYETAIRHWDGYWFGKRRLYGDTFPHYWSALTGNIFADHARLTGDSEYRKKAEASQRGVLSMQLPGGRASCAFVYPVTVNGEKGGFYDPYANDQDWGLYFMLRMYSKQRGNDI